MTMILPAQASVTSAGVISASGDLAMTMISRRFRRRSRKSLDVGALVFDDDAFIGHHIGYHLVDEGFHLHGDARLTEQDLSGDGGYAFHFTQHG